MRKFITFAILAALVAGGLGLWFWRAQAQSRPTFRTATVERGKLIATIGATGTIQPEEVIDVGAQVAGRIEKFGADLRDLAKSINYGSPVEEGTVLAQLDASLYKARRDAAKADLERAKADVLQQDAKVHQARADYERAHDLIGKRAISSSEYELSRAGFETADASAAVTRAQVLQTEAALKEAETNLDYTTIRSPVKGVIIDRRVNVGQTVVAGLTAPSLFLIAKDLRRLEVWATVNEADVGQIKIGQTVHFTVDAYPGRVFDGKVVKQGDYPARLNASMTQNVVTYTVVVSTDNPDGLLWPYLTANLQFVAGERAGALLVPNAALRWRPSPGQVAPEVRAAYARSLREKRAQEQADDKVSDSPSQEQAMVWIVDGSFVRPARVRIGLSDGANTEIVGGDLSEGADVIVGEGRQDDGPASSNPFAPQFFGGKKS